MSEKAPGRRVKVPVGSLAKARRPLSDGALAVYTVKKRGRKQAGWMYISTTQGAKMQVLD